MVDALPPDETNLDHNISAQVELVNIGLTNNASASTPVKNIRGTELGKSNSNREKSMHKCDTCEYKTVNKCNLTRHKRTRHTTVKHACKICNKQFKCRYELKQHVSSHETKLLCHFCSAKFSSRSGLHDHIYLKHSEQKRYSCVTCGKTFQNKTNYTGHVNKHFGIRPFSCTHCKSQFYYKCNLNQHIKNCHGGDAFICKKCGSAFTSLKYLKDHDAGKHAGTGYTCSCGKVYSWRASYCNHRRTCTDNRN